MKDKILSIQYLRGLAALGVVVVHLGLIINIHVNKLIDYIVSSGQLGVAVFFVVSGFILPYSLYQKDYKINSFFSFLLKRSVRIDPPYWATIALVFIIGTVPLKLLNVPLIFLHFFYLVPFVKSASWYLSVFWTLSIEFQFYILLGLSYSFLNRINVNLSILFVLLTSCILIFVGNTTKGLISANFYDFAIGYFVFLGYVGKINRKKMLLILILFSVFVMLKISYISGIVPLATALFIVFYENRKFAPLKFIGDISYSLYLTHMVIMPWFVVYAFRFTKNNFIAAFLCFIVSILFAYLFYILVEKPSINLSKRINRREPPKENDAESKVIVVSI